MRLLTIDPDFLEHPSTVLLEHDRRRRKQYKYSSILWVWPSPKMPVTIRRIIICVASGILNLHLASVRGFKSIEKHRKRNTVDIVLICSDSCTSYRTIGGVLRIPTFPVLRIQSWKDKKIIENPEANHLMNKKNMFLQGCRFGPESSRQTKRFHQDHVIEKSSSHTRKNIGCLVKIPLPRMN